MVVTGAVYWPVVVLTWPISYIITIIYTKEESDKKPPKPVAKTLYERLGFVTGHLIYIAASLRSYLLALLCIYVCYDGYSYPAFGRAATFQLNWMWPIIVKHELATFVMCGLWDWLLYFKFKKKLHRFKFNPIYPSISQFKQDMFWSGSTALMSALVEICLCHLYSIGVFKYHSKTLMDAPIYNLLWASTLNYWRIFHFHLEHRLMHPWKIKYLPFDGGKFLYKHIHSWHHKSYNPTTFSGGNLHPIEAIIYNTVPIICVPFGCHPSVAIAVIIESAIAGWVVHAGFQFPGTGNYFHQLHHEHFDCNYGGESVPIDKWLGTYVETKQDLRKIWGKNDKSIGLKGNQNIRKIHPE
eukprot:184403_1